MMGVESQSPTSRLGVIAVMAVATTAVAEVDPTPAPLISLN
jgi:hypothetical protein